MKLLIVVDMQNDFIDGALGTPQALEIVDRVAQRIGAARAEGMAVWFTRDTHDSNYLQTQEGRNLPIPHCIRGSHGWAIASKLEVFKDSPVIDKPAFGSPELADRAAQLEGLEGIELVGLCTDICVISNALLLKARLPEVPICVRASYCAGATPSGHQTALDAMKACQIAIV